MILHFFFKTKPINMILPSSNSTYKKEKLNHEEVLYARSTYQTAPFACIIRNATI